MVSPQQDFDWESLQGPKSTNQPAQQIQKQDQAPAAESPPQSFAWEDLQSPQTYQGEPDPNADEEMFGYMARTMARTSSRVAEQIVGRAGNIEKAAKDVITNFPVTGGVIGWAISQLVGPEKWERLVKGTPGRGDQLFPTSAQFKQASEELTGGYTKAKTKGESRSDEYIEDIAAALQGRPNPNVPMTSAARQIGVNNILIPVAANVTKNIVEDVGLGTDKGNMAKLAVWTPFSLAFNVNSRQFASNLMNMGRNGFNQNAIVHVPRYTQGMNNVRRNMLQGDPRSALAQQQLSGIENDIANGRTTMRDLMTRYDAINAAKRDRGLFALNPGDRRAAIRNINEVRDLVRTQIQDLGRANPQALQAWENGVQAWATIHRSNAITNWIESVAKGPYAKILTGPAAALFGVGSYGGAKNPLLAGTAAAAVPATYKAGQTIYRMWNDPNLRTYYWNAINEAERRNLPAFLNNYNKLEKGLEKSNSAEKKSESKK